MTETPLISVILPVYNAENYILESINSVLNQTYTNFELIVINDGSKDNSSEVIKSISDKRIIYIEQQNQGLAKTLNNGLKIAKGDFIARQDHDDISLPLRFEKQIQYFLNNKNCGLLGTWATIINEQGIATGQFHKHPTKNSELKIKLLLDNYFVHTSVMFRKDVITNCGTYNETINGLVQDFEYWYRISQHFEIANLPELLINYRQLSTGMSFTELNNNYSTIVAQQSFNNIKHYLTNSQYDLAEKISKLYHGINTVSYTKIDVKQSIDLFNTLVYKINKNQPKAELEELTKRYNFYFTYNYYNSKIYNPTTSKLIVVYYKIKRKLILFFKAKYK